MRASCRSNQPWPASHSRTWTRRMASSASNKRNPISGQRSARSSAAVNAQASPSRAGKLSMRAGLVMGRLKQCRRSIDAPLTLGRQHARMRKASLSKLGASLAVGLVIAFTVANRPLTAPLPDTIDLADMTWVEARAALERGYTTVIVPSGGIEQNGPHMIVGKHDYSVRAAARRIASDLGQTLVAPVISYVPEGSYDPPSGHMRFPGT